MTEAEAGLESPRGAEGAKVLALEEEEGEEE